METQPNTSSRETVSAPTQVAHSIANWQSYLLPIGVALLVVFLVWGGTTMAAEMIHRQVQKEYLNLTDDASRINFAKRRSAHPLGGLVLLGQAHDYYEAGNLAAAKEAYEAASKSGLKREPVMLEEALLGIAFTSYRLDEQKGLEALKALAQNPERMDSTRAHAAGELLGYWVEKQDWKQAKDYWALIKTLKNSGPWQQHYSVFAQLYPQLEAIDEPATK